jgi:ribonuclease-3
MSDDFLISCAQKLGYEFLNIDLLHEALMHRSWQAENNETRSNERLEFLGDAVLGWVVADIAYHRLGDMPEGKLTDLRRSVVNTFALADLARELDIGQFILLGKGEMAGGGRDKSSILADTFEALIGAVYLDGGASAAFAVVEKIMTPSIEDAIPRLDMFDSKTRLQELCARTGRGVPVYTTEGEGPDHERVFTAQVFVSGQSLGHGVGRTKKAAEQVAALAAFDVLAARDA